MAQKIYGEVSRSKNILPENSYANGSDIERFTGKTDIKKLDGNNLIAKGKALKNLTTSITLANKEKSAQATVTCFVSTNSTVHVSGLHFSWN